jgi:hypothetical protein
VLLVIGLIVKFFWWLLAAAAAVGLFFAVRALVRYLQERRAAAARNAEEIAYRADRQNRMAQRGDTRGVYGTLVQSSCATFRPSLRRCRQMRRAPRW